MFCNGVDTEEESKKGDGIGNRTRAVRTGGERPNHGATDRTSPWPSIRCDNRALLLHRLVPYHTSLNPPPKLRELTSSSERKP